MVSIFEFFKDMFIVIFFFLIVLFLFCIGYKCVMLVVLVIVMLVFISMYFGNLFFFVKLFFVVVGVFFVLIKVLVYFVIGLVIVDEKVYNSLMSNVEGVFMFGVVLVYFFFFVFNIFDDFNGWLNVYWLFAGFLVVFFVFFYCVEFDEGDEIFGVDLKEDFLVMFKLFLWVFVIVFIFSVFFFVMIE